MKAHLFPFTDEARFLHPQEIARLITARFPNSSVDWERANSKLQLELEKLELMGAPSPVIEGHKNLFDNTVVVEVYVEDSQEVGVQFVAYIDSPLEITRTHRIETQDEILQTKDLIRDIAKCLNYDVEFLA